MALTIQQASVGYDQSGVEQLKSDIKLKVIDDACNKLDTSFTHLTDAIDEIWAGHSADIFKSNMSNDVGKIKTALTETHRVLEGEINAIVGAMGEVDEELVKNRD